MTSCQSNWFDPRVGLSGGVRSAELGACGPLGGSRFGGSESSGASGVD